MTILNTGDSHASPRVAQTHCHDKQNPWRAAQTRLFAAQDAGLVNAAPVDNFGGNPDFFTSKQAFWHEKDIFSCPLSYVQSSATLMTQYPADTLNNLFFPYKTRTYIVVSSKVIISSLGKNTDGDGHRPKEPPVATQHRPLRHFCGQVVLTQKLGHVIVNVFLLAFTSPMNLQDRHSISCLIAMLDTLKQFEFFSCKKSLAIASRQIRTVTAAAANAPKHH